jgi:hypothetical protein
MFLVVMLLAAKPTEPRAFQNMLAQPQHKQGSQGKRGGMVCFVHVASLMMMPVCSLCRMHVAHQMCGRNGWYYWCRKHCQKRSIDQFHGKTGGQENCFCIPLSITTFGIAHPNQIL